MIICWIFYLCTIQFQLQDNLNHERRNYVADFKLYNPDILTTLCYQRHPAVVWKIWNYPGEKGELGWEEEPTVWMAWDFPDQHFLK